MPGLLIAAPNSGSGKTTVTLGLLRALRQEGHAIRSAKSGPDYIDPQFHAAATGRPCVNLDAWAMPPEMLKTLAQGEDPLIVEGAMGLFDGAIADGRGSAADLARILNLSVILVIDARAMSQSIAPLVEGFARHDPDVRIAGIILNQVGSDRHEAALNSALAPLNIPVLGALPRADDLHRPSRHLGLVQAGEMPDLEPFIAQAADTVAQHVDINALRGLMTGSFDGNVTPNSPIFAPGDRLAVAQDAAFSFIYPHHIADWSAAGTEIKKFSPLANDPVPEADMVFLPGGYPELYAPILAQNSIFMQSLRNASQHIRIYGECGGYMALGETLTDAAGDTYPMAGLLDLRASFAQRKRQLGYRIVRAANTELFDGTYTGHEFHYATTIKAKGDPLFSIMDSAGVDLGHHGLVDGNVSGSFIHLIAQRTADPTSFPIAKPALEA